MRKPALIFAVLFTIIGCLQAQEKRKTDSLALIKTFSKILGEDRKIAVHLPLNYSKEMNKKYPVMYVLDASKLDFDIADRIFTLSSAGMAPECIVVGLLNNKNTRERDMTPPFMKTEENNVESPFSNADRFLKFIHSELIPLIDSSYRTSRYKTISGHSRSGIFVLYTLLKEPGLFNARFCFSAPAGRFNDILIKKLEESLIKKPLRQNSFLFFSVGENENTDIRKSFYSLMNMFRKVKADHLTWESYLTPLADHQTNPVFSSSKAMVSWAKDLKTE